MRMEKNLLPLTTGLVASMMLRADHAVFLPAEMSAVSMMFGDRGDPAKRIPEAITRAVRAHGEAALGRLADLQILEEATGEGFYAPVREEVYRDMLRRFPGMLERVEEAVAAANGVIR